MKKKSEKKFTIVVFCTKQTLVNNILANELFHKFFVFSFFNLSVQKQVEKKVIKIIMLRVEHMQWQNTTFSPDCNSYCCTK